jgi:CHAD domain-containing protein
MAANDIISLNWKKQQDIFLENLATLKLGLSGKAIHDLRVAVKKLRSYLVLYNELTDADEAGLQFFKTDIIFNITGKYRDVEISLDLLGSFKHGKKRKYPSLHSYFQSTLRIAEEKTAIALKKFKPTELQTIGETILKRLSVENADDILKKTVGLSKQKLAAVIVLFKQTAEQPHELRKQLKDLYYWLTILQGGIFLSAVQIKKLNKILDQLGLWQDHQVLLIRTKHFRKDFVAKKTQEHHGYKRLENTLEEKSKKLLAAANVNLQKLLETFENKKPEHSLSRS